MASQPKHAEKESDTAFEQPEFLYRELEGQIDAAYERSNSMMHKMSVTAAARNSRTIKVIRNAMEDTQATLATWKSTTLKSCSCPGISIRPVSSTASYRIVPQLMFS
jgi:hypothetical protein